MKNIYIILVLTLTTTMLSAQDGYTFTLLDNGGFSFTVAAVSNYDSMGPGPQVESYNFTLSVPDGITITSTDIQPGGGEILTPVDGSLAGLMDQDLYIVGVSSVGGARLPDHAQNITIPLYTFTVNGTPTSGELELIDNNSTLAQTFAPQLDSVINLRLDTNDPFSDGYLGQSGITLYNFGTLSTPEFSLTDLTIFPNPAQDFVNLRGYDMSQITSIVIYDVNGKMINTPNINYPQTQQLQLTINTSNLRSGLYFIHLRTDNSSVVKRLIKK